MPLYRLEEQRAERDAEIARLRAELATGKKLLSAAHSHVDELLTTTRRDAEEIARLKEDGKQWAAKVLEATQAAQSEILRLAGVCQEKHEEIARLTALQEEMIAVLNGARICLKNRDQNDNEVRVLAAIIGVLDRAELAEAQHSRHIQREAWEFELRNNSRLAEEIARLREAR